MIFATTKTYSALALGAALVTFASGALAQDDTEDRRNDDEVPAEVSVRQLAFAGSGCPVDSIRGHFPTDPREFLFIADSFAAEAGPGVPARDNRKNCGIILDLDFAAGWQFTVEEIGYNGHVTVDEGVSAFASSYYYFQGSSDTVRFGTFFEGPEDRDYHVADGVGDRDQVWSPCGGGRSLNMNLAVRVTGASGNARGKITFGEDGLSGTHLRLKWRRCE